MAINLGYTTELANDKNNTTATRVVEFEVQDGRVVRNTTPGVNQ